MAQRPTERITRRIDDRYRTPRPGHRHPLARPEFDTGAAEAGTRMERMVMVLEPDAAQQAELEALLEAQQDLASPQYQQWIGPEEFGLRFGVAERDVEQIVSWLNSQGFEVEPVAPGRREIVFSGTAGQVATAFQTEIHVYDTGSELHYANATEPEIPTAMAEVVSGLVSLHDFHSLPMHRQAAPNFTSGGSHYMAPADFATIYNATALPGSSITSTGQSIAVMGRTNLKMSDVQSFRSRFSLPVNDPTVVLNGRDPGIVSAGEQTEATLDVEWAGAVARNAAIKLVVSASTAASDGVALSAQYAVNQNLAPVITVSFGLCESAVGTAGNRFWSQLWQQAAAQGITVLVSSGDSGATGCDAGSAAKAKGGAGVNALCSTPYNVCVGGTQFSDTASPATWWSNTTNPSTYGSALSYIPETAWNASGAVAGGAALWSGGGGWSGVYARPAWQTGTSVPAGAWRAVPDVSLNASTHDGYLVVLNGQLWVMGGTSAAAPAMAGLMAMVVQKNGSRLGNANTALYALAANQRSGGAAVFHDITSGSNSVPGQAGYAAGVGYDMATGLGSVNAAQLVNYWNTAAGR
jgi:subtilase family serine protease